MLHWLHLCAVLILWADCVFHFFTMHCAQVFMELSNFSRQWRDLGMAVPTDKLCYHYACFCNVNSRSFVKQDFFIVKLPVCMCGLWLPLPHIKQNATIIITRHTFITKWKRYFHHFFYGWATPWYSLSWSEMSVAPCVLGVVHHSFGTWNFDFFSLYATFSTLYHPFSGLELVERGIHSQLLWHITTVTSFCCDFLDLLYSFLVVRFTNVTC
jgi:hypothetical protein